MPQEFRWNAELVAQITATPWEPGKATRLESSTLKYRGLYITERMIDTHGPTMDCKKCSTGLGQHSAACRQRFEQIQADLLQEKLEEEEARNRKKGERAAEEQTERDRQTASSSKVGT